MKKNIQPILYFFLFSFQISFVFAQTERVKFASIDKKSDITTQVEKVQPTTNDKKNKDIKSEPISNKSSINLPPIQKSKIESSASLPARNLDKAVLNEQETEKLELEKINSERNSLQTQQIQLETPIFPDLQVVATKESTTEEKLVQMEKGESQLQKLDRIPADDFSTSKKTTPDDKALISPFKRKYLETRTQELENDLKLNSNSAVEIQAKKNELEEIKKLLAQ